MPRRAPRGGRGNRAPRTQKQLEALARLNERPRTQKQLAALAGGRRPGRVLASRSRTPGERAHLTPRQVEVFAREVVPWSLVALVREARPGACVVCSRPLGPKARFACGRARPGTSYRECYFFFRALRVKVAALLAEPDTGGEPQPPARMAACDS